MNKSTQTFEYDIFLSFSGKNESEAKLIWQELSSSGLRVFWSDEILKQNVGQSFFDVIQKALMASRHFVLLWTADSINSYWVKLEYEAFFSHYHLPSPTTRRFVIFKGKTFHLAEIPLFLKNIQTTQSISQILSIAGGVDIRLLQKENQSLKEQNSKYEIKISELQTINKNMANEKEVLQETVKHSQKEIDDIGSQLSDSQKENNILKKQFDESRQTNKKILRKYKQLEEKLKQQKETQQKSPKIEIIQDKDISNEEEKIITNSIGMSFKLIQPGTFSMGSPESEEGRSRYELEHKVTISTPFYIAVTPVTQKQWIAVMNKNPSEFKGKDNPVECVSWDDAKEFIKKINNMENISAYRLPTEAEWEYACRAGTTTKYCFGNETDKLKDYAWYNENSDKMTQPVKQKKPNSWGLYDMHGNVWEWCEDWFGEYSSKHVTDPKGPDVGSDRVVRGGSWSYSPVNVRGCSHFRTTFNIFKFK